MGGIWSSYLFCRLEEIRLRRPEPHPFALRVDNCLSAFLQAREQVLINLGTNFKVLPKVLDKMESALPEVLLCLYPT